MSEKSGTTWLTTTEALKRWRTTGERPLSRPALLYHLRQGAIPGAYREQTPGGAYWLIPADALAAFDPPPRGWRKGRRRKLIESENLPEPEIHAPDALNSAQTSEEESVAGKADGSGKQSFNGALLDRAWKPARR